MDAPIRAFLDRLDAALAEGVDPDAIAAALAALASEADYFSSVIAPVEENITNGAALHVPDRGPRLFLMHRPRGVMSYVHSHGTWAAVAPVRGVETHRRYDVASQGASGRADLVVADERVLRPGDAAVIVPPNDIHSHGHSGGDDDTPYTLIVTGDDQLQFARRQYDLEAGTYRDLPPGDFGTLDLPAVP